MAGHPPQRVVPLSPGFQPSGQPPRGVYPGNRSQFTPHTERSHPPHVHPLPRPHRHLRLHRRAPPGVPRPALRLPPPAEHQRARDRHRRDSRDDRRRSAQQRPGTAHHPDRRLAGGPRGAQRRAGGTDGHPLRPLRRAAARPARRLGLAAVRADHPRRAHLGARRRRQQGAALRADSGVGGDRGGARGVTLQRQGAARRRGGNRQPAHGRLRARPPRRPRGRPRDHLRWPGGRERAIADRLRRARGAQLRAAGARCEPRPPLRQLGRRRAEPDLDAGASPRHDEERSGRGHHRRLLRQRAAADRAGIAGARCTGDRRGGDQAVARSASVRSAA